MDKYDTDNKISIKSDPERYQQIQWLAFQISGQGPYFGQAAWFGNFHHEKLPSAVERYQKEIERVTAVLDGQLAKGDGWLVGGKCTYADLAFIPWATMGPWLAGDKVDFGKVRSLNGSFQEGGQAPWRSLPILIGEFPSSAVVDSMLTNSQYPAYQKWLQAMQERPAVKKVLAEKAEASKKH